MIHKIETYQQFNESLGRLKFQFSQIWWYFCFDKVNLRAFLEILQKFWISKEPFLPSLNQNMFPEQNFTEDLFDVWVYPPLSMPLRSSDVRLELVRAIWFRIQQIIHIFLIYL